jgi:hypothetical protein
MRCGGGSDRTYRNGNAGIGLPKRGEVRETIGATEDVRVRHRVSGAGKKVGEADGLAETPRKDRQRQVEAAADPAKEIAEQRTGFSRGRTGGLAGRGNPSPS